MSFKRVLLPEKFRTGSELTAGMIAIGMRFGGYPSKNPNIEDTLVAASIEGILKGDGRVMSLLVDWLDVHSDRVNVDRLSRMVDKLEKKKYLSLKIFWTAIAQRFKKDRRFLRLSRLYVGTRVNYFKLIKRDSKSYDPTEFLLNENGEDLRFKGTCLRVPNQTFRHRLRDVDSQKAVARRHSTYRLRVMMGPSYRTDMWACYRAFRGNASEVARACYGSYDTARQVIRDYEIAKSHRKRMPVK